jgi:photosystem II stability/assembly factor-like uncharacterized protein
MNARLTFLLGLVLGLLNGSVAMAQVFTEPIRVHAPTFNREAKSEVPRAVRRYLQSETSSDTLPLPFQDDFSGKDLSWAPSRFLFGKEIRHLHFQNNEEARGLGANGLNILSTDRGNRWIAQSVSPGDPDFIAADFQTPSNGWACGKSGFLGYTTDGGQTWTSAPAPPSTRPGTALISLSFRDAQTGLVVDSAGRLFRTNNGGQTWDTATYDFPRRFIPRSATWINASIALVVGDSGRMGISTNGAASFSIQNMVLQGQRALRQVQWFPFAGFGMALGDSGLAFKISNQGNTWRQMNLTLPFQLYRAAVNPINTNLVWIVGERGTLLYSQNGAEGFSRLRSGTVANLRSIALVNEFRGWIGTDDGRLLQVVIDPLRPVSRFWEPNSGVLINDGFALSPPTVGVATFDGLNQYGLPYSNVRRKTGPCDTLTSAFLDVAGFANVPLFISFFFQPGNRQMQLIPDPEDSLVLQARRPNGTWTSLWNTRGSSVQSSVDRFFYRSILIPEELKSKGFKFRFINFGTQNGNFDVWNLDYVRVDGEHGPNDSTDLDYGIGRPFPRLMKSWSALPIPQLEYVQENNLDVFPERIAASVTNFVPGQANVAGIFSVRRVVPDSVKTVLTLDNNAIQGLGNPLPQGISYNEISVRTQDFRNSIRTKTPCTFEYGLALNPDPVTNRYLLNDTSFSRFNASTFMAYDDGTAELARGVADNNNIGAVKYFLPTEDTLTDIQLYFIRTPENVQQQINFTLLVYDTLNPSVDDFDPQPILRRQVILPPADSVNQFLTFSVRSSTVPERRILKGNRHFYVAWQQGAIDNGNEVRIGVDINNRNPGTFYYKFSTQWEVDNSPESEFPFLLRPVFGPEVVTSVLPRLARPQFPFYPNPAQNKIHNRQPFRHLLVRDVLGRTVLDVEKGNGGESVDIDLPPGIYSLVWEEENGQPVTQKLLIQ